MRHVKSATGSGWHIRHPLRPGYTVCGARSSPKGEEKAVEGEILCSRCRRVLSIKAQNLTYLLDFFLALLKEQPKEEVQELFNLEKLHELREEVK